jgi:hypothetical protein
MTKEEQKQHLIDMMRYDENLGLYKETEQMNLGDVSGSPYNYSEKDVRTNTKVPIKRGCPNKQCFCTGKCNEIIGWRDKLSNEF